MSNYFKKIILSFLASLVLIFSFAPYLLVNAQSPKPVTPTSGQWYNQDFFSWFNKVYDVNTGSEIFGERYTAAQVQWVVYGLISLIINLSGSSEIFTCVASNNGDLTNCAGAIESVFSNISNKNIIPNTALENNKSLTSLVFADRPMSGIGYVKEKIDNFRLIPEAKAQTVGFGFDALKPIQDMWRGTRNVAFGLFVLASIIFAFMIMFRVKINPQTVITVQSAIPKVITALILVTFSYAIAGFLIDLMYVVIGILSLILSNFFKIGSLGVAPSAIFDFLVYGQPFGFIQAGIFGFLFTVTFPFWLVLITFTGLLLAGAATGIGLVFWIFFIPIIIVCLMILWIGIKTIWALFKAFANIILLVIFGPLQIALGILIPNFGFGQWVKSIISHLSVFVVTGVLGFLSVVFVVQGATVGLSSVPGGGTLSEVLFNKFGIFAAIAPNAIKNIPTSPWPPLLGTGEGVWTGMLFLGVSFVLFTMIPKATELVASFLAGKPFAYGSAIGEALGPLNWTRQQVWNNTGAPFLEARRRAMLETRLGDPNSWEHRLDKTLNTFTDNLFKKKKELAN